MVMRWLLTVQNKDWKVPGRLNKWKFLFEVETNKPLFSRKNFKILEIILRACVIVTVAN